MKNYKVLKKQKKLEKKYDASMQMGDVEKVLKTKIFKTLQQEASLKSIDLKNLLFMESRLIRFDTGEAIYNHTDYGNSCFVVLSGEIQSYIPQRNPHNSSTKQKKNSVFSSLAQIFDKHTNSEIRDISSYMSNTDLSYSVSGDAIITTDKSQLIEDQLYGTADIFGHISAISRTARYETLIATQRTECIELKWQALREINKFSRFMKQKIDHDYKNHGLAHFLRTLEPFSNLANEQISELVDNIKIEHYGNPDWNINLRKARKDADSDLNLAHTPIVKKGDYFEDILVIRSGFVKLDLNTGPSYMTSSQIIGLDENITKTHAEFAIDSILFSEVLRIPKKIMLKFNITKANTYKSIADKSASLNKLYGENLFTTGRKSMLINLDKCTECDDCVTACASAHGGSPRFTRQGPQVANFMVANACMHCKDPVCTIGCPTGAIQRNSADGSIIINDQTCIGCSTCANACPFDNIKMTNIVDENGNNLVDENHSPIVKATKCDLCYQQSTTPACEYACPNDALKRIDIDADSKKLKYWI